MEMSTLDIVMTFESGVERVLQAQAPLMIGRDAQCGLRISSWRVSKHHARLCVSGTVLELEDLGSLLGTLVNGRRVTIHRPLLPSDDIVIGPCRIRIRQSGSSKAQLATSPYDLLSSSYTGEQHQTSASDSSTSYARMNTVRATETYSEVSGLRSEQKAYLLSTDTSMVNVATVDRLSGVAADAQSEIVVDSLSYRRRLHAGLHQALDLRRRDVAGMSDATLRSEAQALLEEISVTEVDIPLSIDRAALCREVLDEAVGLGPLDSLLADPTISEIMVNRYDQIYIERHGRLMRHEASFSSEQAVRWVIERIVTPIGRRIDESSPMVDARLPDGSRVNAVIPPVALKGANITIRKFPAQRLQMIDLIQGGTLSATMADFLLLCVRTRKNVVISGGTGAGKTTLLNILSNGIPHGERIVTIEDAAELQLNHEHLVALEARPENLENRGRIDIRDLVRNALRMRPDRIVVGECRGAEAFDMLTAMNTGHEGSLTTLHANSPRDALSRLEVMVLMAGMDLPLSVVREHISASVEIVVQQVRLPQGRRIVQSITEVTGLESGRIQMQELFRYKTDVGFQGCGLVPSFIEEWQATGTQFDFDAFSRLETESARGGNSVV